MGHVQAAWLLSVDRQEVQSLQDNAWNLAIAQQLPQLLLCALRHLAASVAAATATATAAAAKTAAAGPCQLHRAQDQVPLLFCWRSPRCLLLQESDGRR